jgi:hypothetical protein
MLSVRTVRMTASTVMAFGAGWLAKTNAQQKAPAPHRRAELGCLAATRFAPRRYGHRKRCEVLLSEPTKGLQAPFVFPAIVLQNIQVAVIRPDLVKSGVRSIPLIEYFLDHVSTVLELELDWPFVRLSSFVTLHP